MQRAEEWWWSVGVTVELGWCSDSFRPLKPRSRKKRRLRAGLGLRHLMDEPPWSGGGWWSERSLSCWPWRGLERAQAEIEEKEKERGLVELVYCGGLVSVVALMFEEGAWRVGRLCKSVWERRGWELRVRERWFSTRTARGYRRK